MRRALYAINPRLIGSADRSHYRRWRCRAHRDIPRLIWKTSMSLLILVVDDEPDVEVLFRQHFRRDLRTGRFTMEFAQSGPAALQRISDAVDVSLIIILSDINMPGMSGLELLPRAKALRPDVPVIMITAYGDAETKRKALENGAEALLTKPIDFATLRNEIDLRVERAACPFGTRSTDLHVCAVAPARRADRLHVRVRLNVGPCGS